MSWGAGRLPLPTGGPVRMGVEHRTVTTQTGKDPLKRDMLSLLLVFSVTPLKIDENKKSKLLKRLRPESGNTKKVYMQILSPRFRSKQFFLWEICGETFFPNL